jgi:Flp pilus assembly protein TadG
VLVEAVVIIPVIVALLMGFIQFSSMYFTRHAMVHAAREGARALSVQDATVAQAVQRTSDVLAALGYDPADFEVAGSETTTDGTITVLIQAVKASIIGDPFGFMGEGSTLTTAAVMKDEQY